MTDGQLDRIDEENEEDNNNNIASDEQIHQETNFKPGENTAEQEELLPRLEEVRRECFECKETIENHSRNIQPCCCGYWMHHRCLVLMIQRFEINHPLSGPLECNLCFMPYNIWPRKTPLVKAMEMVSIRYGQFNNFGFQALGVILADTSFAVMGLSTLEMIYGPERTAELLLTMGSLKAAAICKTIPLASIAVNSIPWEDKLLQFLRCCSGLPFVGWMFPLANRRVREKKHRRTQLGVITGGLLLPWHANKLGFVLFWAVQSRFQRFLLGGVAFLALKGMLQMYYRQKLYARNCSLSVEAYNNE